MGGAMNEGQSKIAIQAKNQGNDFYNMLNRTSQYRFLQKKNRFIKRYARMISLRFIW